MVSLLHFRVILRCSLVRGIGADQQRLRVRCLAGRARKGCLLAGLKESQIYGSERRDHTRTFTAGRQSIAHFEDAAPKIIFRLGCQSWIETSFNRGTRGGPNGYSTVI